ncbi:MAG: hypothetical protein KKA64_03170 [Nanoarchaeota archaeon]|nr:hypothetical protein [Nanoarchaeota archaeon]
MIDFKEAAFYDLFGFVGFVFITILATQMLVKNKLPAKWAIIVLLAIGISGIIVDGIMTYLKFIK